MKETKTNNESEHTQTYRAEQHIPHQKPRVISVLHMGKQLQLRI